MTGRCAALSRSTNAILSAVDDRRALVLQAVARADLDDGHALAGSHLRAPRACASAWTSSPSAAVHRGDRRRRRARAPAAPSSSLRGSRRVSPFVTGVAGFDQHLEHGRRHRRRQTALARPDAWTRVLRAAGADARPFQNAQRRLPATSTRRPPFHGSKRRQRPCRPPSALAGLAIRDSRRRRRACHRCRAAASSRRSRHPVAMREIRASSIEKPVSTLPSESDARGREQERDVRADAENREVAQRGHQASDGQRRAFRRTRSPSRAADRSGPTPRRLRRRPSRCGRRAAAARGRAGAAGLRQEPLRGIFGVDARFDRVAALRRVRLASTAAARRTRRAAARARDRRRRPAR